MSSENGLRGTLQPRKHPCYSLLPLKPRLSRDSLEQVPRLAIESGHHGADVVACKLLGGEVDWIFLTGPIVNL